MPDSPPNGNRPNAVLRLTAGRKWISQRELDLVSQLEKSERHRAYNRAGVIPDRERNGIGGASRSPSRPTASLIFRRSRPRKPERTLREDDNQSGEQDCGRKHRGRVKVRKHQPATTEPKEYRDREAPIIDKQA